jgi:hypothetical protein
MRTLYPQGCTAGEGAQVLGLGLAPGCGVAAWANRCGSLFVGGEGEGRSSPATIDG